MNKKELHKFNNRFNSFVLAPNCQVKCNKDVPLIK